MKDLRFKFYYPENYQNRMNLPRLRGKESHQDIGFPKRMNFESKNCRNYNKKIH
jgi:hypothetical protein